MSCLPALKGHRQPKPDATSSLMRWMLHPHTCPHPSINGYRYDKSHQGLVSARFVYGVPSHQDEAGAQKTDRLTHDQTCSSKESSPVPVVRLLHLACGSCSSPLCQASVVTTRRRASHLAEPMHRNSTGDSLSGRILGPPLRRPRKTMSGMARWLDSTRRKENKRRSCWTSSRNSARTTCAGAAFMLAAVAPS